MASYILVGELLFQISSSRVLYLFIIILSIYFILNFYSRKDYFKIKKNKLLSNIALNVVFLNLTYIIALILINLSYDMEYGRNYLAKESLVEIFNGLTILPSTLFNEKELLYSSHNQLLEITRTTGLIGILYFLWFIDRLFNKSNNMMQLILTIYLYSIIGLFILPFTHPYSYSVLGLLILITGGLKQSENNYAKN